MRPYVSESQGSILKWLFTIFKRTEYLDLQDFILIVVLTMSVLYDFLVAIISLIGFLRGLSFFLLLCVYILHNWSLKFDCLLTLVDILFWLVSFFHFINPKLLTWNWKYSFNFEGSEGFVWLSFCKIVCSLSYWSIFKFSYFVVGDIFYFILLVLNHLLILIFFLFVTI